MNGDEQVHGIEEATHSSPVDGATRPSHIVGIGASAGGLEALEQFFKTMPPRTGMAFVVVQHLSPDFKSLTDVLLARRTSIPIHRVENGMEVRPDAIYLLPPKTDMIISNGKLLLTDKDPAQTMSMPIDHFFRSLAQDAGERSIGIILSGTGSDGSRGVREIHEAGGLVIAQKPETAKFDGMPNSAKNTGIVDFVLAPEEMPAALARYASHAADEGPAEEACLRNQESDFDAIFRQLRDGYGIDFSHYRPATVLRRTERRLQMTGDLTLNDYVRRLHEEPEELNALYKDLLIGVTRFFRDPEAFASLEHELLPQLLEQAERKGEEFRAWVAGCATGEEAYSLAILIRECCEALGRGVPVKVFATDVHLNSLEFASAGLYPEASLAGVSPDRLGRNFVRKGDGYQVTPELRKTVVFAHHNLLKDAPFTKLDLITCRNLLIYFQPAAQKKVLSLFHFGLKTGGALFLGPSESAGELGDEFEVVDARWKLFRKRRDIRLATDIRLALPGAPGGRPVGIASAASNQAESQTLTTYNALLSRYMPPSLLVNERRELVQSFAGANRYLKPKEGPFSADVLDMVDPELRMALTGALQRALAEVKSVSYKGIRVTLPEGERVVNVTVDPIPNPRANVLHALIALEEVGAPRPRVASPQEIDLDRASREHVVSLESELRFTKENLQATIEELETSNEELQATNEELVASNEELQSTNEELHSVNEELYTVNAEYQKKIAELTELSTDIENLLASTEVHTVFLDRELCIRKFTPKIAEAFNFLPQDVGRRLDSFTHSIDHPNLPDDLQSVLRTAVPVEKQVRDGRGNWFLLRILPYRVGPAVDGVVMTLIDIGTLKRLEAESQRKDQQLAALLEHSPNPVAMTDREGRFVVTDDSFRQLVGRDPAGKTARELFQPSVAEVLTSQLSRVVNERISVQTEVTIDRADGPHTYLTIQFPLQQEQGKVTGVGHILTDVTQMKVAEGRALEAVTQRDRFLAMLSHELRNPLAAILNSTTAFRLSRSDAAAHEELFGIIERRARHMARLLDDLLDVARLTQNKIEIRKTTFDLAATVGDVVEEVRPVLESRGVALDVSRLDAPLAVDGDPARLQQIQVNLLMNAAKYTPQGGRVWYRLQREDDQAVIRVRDTGAGIAADMLERVFDLFVQADSMLDRSSRGIGVGLTLVRSIVALHRGSVKAYSDGPGKGSEFVVRLPLARAGVGAEPGSDGVAQPAAVLRGREVLIVEDDEDIRETLQAILKNDGMCVRAVADGPAALAALEGGLPAVALLDIGLPGMSGYELARAIRQKHGPNGVRLVALTGFGQASDRQAAREAGFDTHLTKPLKPSELYRALGSLLGAGSSERT